MSEVLRIDSVGRRCPQPVIDLANAIRTVPIGAVVEVLADDPVAAVDIPAWCWTQGHEYLGVRQTDANPGHNAEVPVDRVRRLA
ncbi:MAG: tRNA 2-thiouridine synthesizing protein [Frankiaceae bacterium]|nr:tRNA 2-thiouridine synthesizing protein [Frankiaceae bacterium]